MDDLLQMIGLNNRALGKSYSYLLNKNHVSSVLQMSLQAILKKSEQKARGYYRREHSCPYNSTGSVNMMLT